MANASLATPLALHFTIFNYGRRGDGSGDNAVWTVHGLGKMRDKVKEVSVRKGIVWEFVTLDGAVENPGGAEGFEHGWVGRSTARPGPQAAH
jgi:hypothetical protein